MCTNLFIYFFRIFHSVNWLTKSNSKSKLSSHISYINTLFHLIALVAWYRVYLRANARAPFFFYFLTEVLNRVDGAKRTTISQLFILPVLCAGNMCLCYSWIMSLIGLKYLAVVLTFLSPAADTGIPHNSRFAFCGPSPLATFLHFFCSVDSSRQHPCASFLI